MSNANRQKIITKDEWEKRLADVKISKEDLNKIVMNYLIIEGYKDAAERFQQESGTTPEVDLNTITDRMEIRNSVQSGDIEEAIKRVQVASPDVLSSQGNTELLFHLQQQQLIELIRGGNIQQALAFAQQNLASKAETNPAFLEELERTMGLLAFDLNTQSPFADLLDPAQRLKTATELNAAILTSQNQEKEPKLPTLLKMLKWSQSQTIEKVKYPKIANFATAEFDSQDS
eukprot:TRINITY_DN5323_c0_g1_i1.p1 TRINITY_DN5323_c0_g1~~TRINITY_DN5323_c0_g1_i1.p1  ORF type:complete len:231 (-),score=57.77 TRINITY_DN5323_c0_g1_i1:45-737(-)